MSKEGKQLKITFAPGCFDSFEGTQEELNELIAQIHHMFESGEALDVARQINFEDPSDEDLETIEHIYREELEYAKRTLQ